MTYDNTLILATDYANAIGPGVPLLTRAIANTIGRSTAKAKLIGDLVAEHQRLQRIRSNDLRIQQLQTLMSGDQLAS